MPLLQDPPKANSDLHLSDDNIERAIDQAHNEAGIPLDDLASRKETSRVLHGSKQDQADLAKFGKKQQLRRNFRLLSVVGLTCTLMVTWEGTLSTFESGLTNGGPAGLVYGFLFVWIGTFLQAAVMGEMASMVPLSGGPYNWVAVLSPPWCSKFLSYLTGWMSIIAWQATMASAAFLSGTMTQGLVVLNHPDYTLERWHGTLIFYAVVLFSLFINTYLARILPEVEALVLLFHLMGYFAVMIPLVYLAPHGTAKSVFATFTTEGGWPNKGISFFVGTSTGMFSFIGCDAASHLAEEIQSASEVIPKSMLVSVALNGTLGFSMIIAALFCLGDLESALETETGFPFIQVFTNATGSRLGGTLMSSVIVATTMFAEIGYLAGSSRMAWAFARERGLPGSRILSKVQPRTNLPIYTIGLSTVISLLLALINIGSTTAFNALTSLVIAAYFSTFVVAAGVLLQKRLTTAPEDMNYGPFHLGRFGVPIIVLAIAYSMIGIFFSFWPPEPSPNAESMNWSIAVFGGTLVLSMVFWLVHGRKVYEGPLEEIQGRPIRSGS